MQCRLTERLVRCSLPSYSLYVMVFVFWLCSRAAQCLKISSDMECMQVMQNLSMNLATKSSIRTTLRQQLISINGHENLLSDIVTTCVRMYETRLYVEPSEKYLLVKVASVRLHHTLPAIVPDARLTDECFYSMCLCAFHWVIWFCICIAD